MVITSTRKAIARYRVGIDIGGTFTDFSLIDSKEGRLYSGKTLTTPEEPERGVVEGLKRFLAECQIVPAELDAVIHATTLVSNWGYFRGTIIAEKIRLLCLVVGHKT